MYLVLGAETDSRCRGVAERLREQGRDCLMVSDPFGGNARIAWHIDSDGPRAALTLSDQRKMLEGVVVPWPRQPDPCAAQVDERARVREVEQTAALLAWLWTLECPVINKLPAELWFRPHRSPVEWRPVLEAHDLPVIAAQITNTIADAVRFGERWGGRVAYRPVTSATRYPIADATAWTELAKLVAHVPVCLVQPVRGRFYACVAGACVTWSEHADTDASWRTQTEARMRRLTHTLGLTQLQLEFGWVEERAPLCVDVSLFPEPDRYGANRQLMLGALVSSLGRGA